MNKCWGNNRVLKFRERPERKACTSLEKESSHSLLTLLNSNSRWPAAYDRNCYSCVVHTHAVYIIAASSWMKQTIRGWAYGQSREERRRNTHGSVFSRAFSIGNSYVHERMPAKQWPDNRETRTCRATATVRQNRFRRNDACNARACLTRGAKLLNGFN